MLLRTNKHLICLLALLCLTLFSVVAFIEADFLAPDKRTAYALSANYVITVNGGEEQSFADFGEAWDAVKADGVTEATFVMHADYDMANLPYYNNGNLQVSGWELDFDLNGHTLTGTEYSEIFNLQGKGEKIGKLTLSDSSEGQTGRITGHRKALDIGDGGEAVMNGGTISGISDVGVKVQGFTAKFTMNGGKITECTSSSEGGGVFADNGTLIMTGGEISGNTASYGGGVYCFQTSLYVSGAVKITGNISINSAGKETTANVRLANTGKIIVAGKLEDAAGDKAQIGVTPHSYKSIYDYDVYNSGVVPSTYFIPDEEGKCVSLSGSINTHRAGFSWISDENGHYRPCANNCGAAFDESAHDFVNSTKYRYNEEGHWKVCAQCDNGNGGLNAHSYGNWETTLAPTCAALGSKKHTCTVCSHEETKEIAIDPDAHSWDPESVRVEPTCTTDGSVTGTCTDCGETDTEILDKLGHDIEWHEAQAETCTQIGWDAYVTCSRCDHTTYSEKEALGHDFDTKFTVDTAATCTAKGSKSKRCVRCDEKTDVTEIPLVPHTLTHVARVEPTLLADGNIEYWTCSVCENKYSDEDCETEADNVVIPMLKAQLVQPDENGGADHVVVTTPNGFASDIELVVTEIARENYAQYATIARAVNGEIFQVYDVTLRSDGVTVQPDGTIIVKLRIPDNLKGKDFKLFHLHGSEATDKEYTIEGNYAVVTVDKLSEFIFIGGKFGAAPDPSGGLSAGAVAGITIGVIVAVLLSAYFALYFALYRKGVIKGKAFDVIYIPMNEVFNKKKQDGENED